MLKTRLFEERGFKRYRCKVCGHYFWSLVERDTCGDAPCTPYSFIGASPARITVEKLSEVRELFLSFFEKHGHTRVRRYPVVAARWRTDVYLVGASIYVFQPWVTEGIVPPPANPLVISQPCIRLTDIDIVGRSGRHLTAFEMMAHHAFNYPDKYVYWIDETVELAHRFFTEVLKIPEEEIVYKESTWSGGGNAGECFEVLVRGLEIATLVFMHYKILPDGKLEEMRNKIVDTGYGLERIYWLVKASPNIYEAVYGPVLERLRQKLGLTRPDSELLSQMSVFLSQLSSEQLASREIFKKLSEKLGLAEDQVRKVVVEQEFLYSIPDHIRSFSWMVYDGVMPSNSGIGYLARLLLRRLLRYSEILKIETPLVELADTCLSFLLEEYPELKEVRDVILELLDQEEKKFREVVKQATTHISKLVKKGKKSELSLDDLVFLYDAYGIPPEVVEQTCASMGVKVSIPDNFYAILAERKQREVAESTKEQRKIEIMPEDVADLPATEELFYHDPYLKEFTARVLRVLRRGDRTYVVLDRTAFYPEGGGQPYDTGVLILPDGSECRVVNVQRVGNVIVHEVICRSVSLREGVEVKGVIDWERRYALMKMHTGTHILLQALRRVLGAHVWQTGVQKDIPASRLDITHYKVLAPDEIRKVEELANKIVEEDWPVQVEYLVRTEAESKYSVRIYQGGFIPAPTLRIVKIARGDEVYDVQACGGTHVRSTREVGAIKIIGVEKIQEGVIRIHFTTGKYVFEYLRSLEEKLNKVADALKCSIDEVPERVLKLVQEVRQLEETIRKYEKKLAELIQQQLATSVERIEDIEVSIIQLEEVSDKLIQDVARQFTAQRGRLLVVVSRSRDTTDIKLFSSSDVGQRIPMRELVQDICRKIEQCRGGGSATFAQISIRGVVEVEHLRKILLEVLASKLSATS